MPLRAMPLPSAPALSAGEWRAVQQALRAVQDSPCPQGERPGPWRRGLARIGRIMHPHTPPVVAPELAPLRDFLCESARHGPRLEKLAEALERQGYTPAQIAALSLIAG